MARPGDQDYWLGPMDESVALPCLGVGDVVEFKSELPGGMRLERGGLLPLTLEQYLKLLDWTARQKRAGKRGVVPADVAPILDRLGLTSDAWLNVTGDFGERYSYAAGTASSMAEFAKKVGRRWLRGTRHSRDAFGR